MSKTYTGIKIASLTNGTGETEYPRVEEFPLISHSAQRINSVWIKDLFIRPETLKVLEKTRKSLDIGIGKDFLTKTPTAWEIIPGADKWNYM